MQAARDRQKSYADLKRKPMEFQVGDKVMLKVSPGKGVVHFGKWGKLNPRYVGPLKVLERVGDVAYKLDLLEELSRVHNTFHVSNLKKCHAGKPLAVPLDGLHFDDKLHFVEEPVEILDCEVKWLKRSRFPLVKVRWNSKRGPEFTWEREDQFRKNAAISVSKEEVIELDDSLRWAEVSQSLCVMPSDTYFVHAPFGGVTAKDLEEPTHEEIITGSCKSLVELEYFFEEVYKATTDQLDWKNPEGQQYPHDLQKPLPLIPNSWGRRVIHFDHFINNDLDYLSGECGVKCRSAMTKHALWGISHWGQKRQQIYGFAANRETARDVYSKRRIITVTELQIVKWHNYKNLDWITVRRDDDKLYKFKEEKLYTSAGNPVKEILLKLNLPDHSDEVLRLKNFKKDALSKLFKLSNQERYDHVGPKVTSAQGGKDYKMAKRDYAWLMISRGTCEKSATNLLTLVEYFTNHTK
nr:putative reverse transcriptase domain-containing protein [Tanacetum cinerariifolium]